MHFTLQHHIEDFLAYGRQRGHSEHTIAAYRNALGKFREFAAKQEVTTAEAVTRSLLRAYASDVTQTMSPGGAHARLRPLKTFFRWLEADEILEKSPMARVALPKLPRMILKAVGPEDIKLLMKVAQRSRHPLRDRALLAVLYDTGLRVSELCALHLRDIQPGGRLTVREAKGKQSRIVPVSRVTLRHLHHYIQSERPDSVLPEVFLTTLESAMNRDPVKQLLERLCRAAGTEIYTPHCF